MNMRCACGNEVQLINDNEGTWLDRTWYNEERNELECPKCKHKTLPLPVVLTDEVTEVGPIKVRTDFFRSITLTRKR